MGKGGFAGASAAVQPEEGGSKTVRNGSGRAGGTIWVGGWDAGRRGGRLDPFAESLEDVFAGFWGASSRLRLVALFGVKLGGKCALGHEDGHHWTCKSALRSIARRKDFTMFLFVEMGMGMIDVHRHVGIVDVDTPGVPDECRFGRHNGRARGL